MHIFPLIGIHIESTASHRVGRQCKIEPKYYVHIAHMSLPREGTDLISYILLEPMHLPFGIPQKEREQQGIGRGITERLEYTLQLIPHALSAKQQPILGFLWQTIGSHLELGRHSRQHTSEISQPLQALQPIHLKTIARRRTLGSEADHLFLLFIDT